MLNFLIFKVGLIVLILGGLGVFATLDARACRKAEAEEKRQKIRERLKDKV